MQEKKHERPKLIDETGNRYGKLVVLYRGENKGNKVIWVCRCDCGNERKVAGWSLRSGATRSCGCLQKEASSANIKKFNQHRARNLAGKQYGRLTVIKQTENIGNDTGWLCRCECGNEITVRGDNLCSGNTRSCGCIVREGVKQQHFTREQIAEMKRVYEDELLTYREIAERYNITTGIACYILSDNKRKRSRKYNQK